MGITGIILAGGKSSRMQNYPKGLLALKKATIIEHIISELKLITPEIIISANSEHYNHLGFPVIQDIIKEKGPIGGIYSALRNSSNHKNLIVACDMPMISASFMNELINNSENCDAVIPKSGERLQPLYACYTQNSLTGLLELINEDKLKLQNLPQKLNCKILETRVSKFGIQEQYININTPEEYNQFKSEL